MEISSKYYAILLLGTLANAPNAYALKASSVDMLYTNTDASGGGFMTVKKATSSYNTNPCDATSPCDTGLTVAHNDVFTVLPITGKTTLESETDFLIDGTFFSFSNKSPDTSLHTSCSAPLSPGIFGTVTIGLVTHTLTVVDVGGGDKECVGVTVGGSGFVIDKTALLVSGAQMNAAWMIPVLVAGIGFAIVIARKF